MGLAASERDKAWATVVALWVLKMEFAKKEAEWKRIAVKARKFLKQLGIEAESAMKLI